MLSAIGSLASWAFDWILPLDCLGCSTSLGTSEHWCQDCRDKLEFNTATHCEGGYLFAPFRHVGPIRKALHRLKYQDRSDFARRLVRAGFGPRPDAVATSSLLVPVPLHAQRLASRGYNQAALLAGAIGKLWHLGVKLDLLYRSVATKPQVGQSRAERLLNLQGAFTVAPTGASNAALWLVDDVVTTGATLSSCRCALSAAGYSVSGIIAVSHASSDDFVSVVAKPNDNIG